MLNFYFIYVQYVQKLWMEFVKFRQSSELNFNHLKKEIEGLNLKMDELKQLLLEVSDMFTCLNFLILQCFDICVFSYLLLLGGVCNFRLRVRMRNTVCMTLDSENLVQKKMITIWALISRLEFFRML